MLFPLTVRNEGNHDALDITVEVRLKGVIFVDNDFDGKLSPGDKFEVHPGESGSELENTNSVDDYKFRLKFEPTGDTIGYDTPLS